MLEKALSQLEHAKAQEVQPLPAVCRLSSTVAGVLLASARELLKGTAFAGLLGSRLRRGPKRRQGSPVHLSREQRPRHICMQDTCASTPC
jgi:hypothetical protein